MPTSCGCNAGVVEDTKMGHTVCKSCGLVLEEATVIAEVGFTDSVADGFFIGRGQARAKSGGSGYNKYGSKDESEKHLQTIANGARRIGEIANSLNMTQRHIEAAERNYKLAVIHGFTKGRKIMIVAACCLYIVCRLEKTSHMLMDFSDVLSTSPYAIGSTYMKLVIILNLRESIPHIDPTLFLSRFASKLDFKEKSQAVINDSLRLVQRMNRDWMHIGRRPAGICAAALFMAARMNGFNRTGKEIIHVVKICLATLKRRLDEFSSTRSAKLSVNEFKNVWLEESEDPPCFEQSAHTFSATTKRKLITDGNTEEEEEEEEEEELVQEMEDALQDSHLKSIMRILEAKGQGEDLSALDEDWEVSNALLTQDEIDFKAEIWGNSNYEWTEQQKHKKTKPASASDAKKRGKRRKKEEVPLPPAASAFDSVSNMLQAKQPTLSSKINYEALEGMFDLED